MSRGERAVLALLLGALMTIIAACTDPLEAPPCAPVPFTEVSMSGDTITTSTGLRYVNVSPGLAGGGVVEWCRTLAIHYDAFLADGTKFDSSRPTPEDEQPLLFTPGVGDLLDGLEQGVIGLRLGAERTLIIPPELGFGSVPVLDPISGEVIIPGNSTLIYDIQVVAVSQ